MPVLSFVCSLMTSAVCMSLGDRVIENHDLASYCRVHELFDRGGLRGSLIGNLHWEYGLVHPGASPADSEHDQGTRSR